MNKDQMYTKLSKDYCAMKDEVVQLRVEIERKDEALKCVVDTYNKYYGDATDMHLEMEDVAKMCKQVLSEEE
jgi:hypothetical protein